VRKKVYKTCKHLTLLGRREFLKIGFGSLSFFGLSNVCKASDFTHYAPSTSSVMQVAPSDDIDDIYQGLNLYFGDIHGHTGFSDGYGLPDEYYQRARFDHRLDFAACSEHAEWINYFQNHISMMDGTPIPLWELTVESVISNYSPGKFVTLVGFEWTCDRYGHRNAYFRDTYNIPSEPFGFDKHRTPDDLWRALEPYHALTISHHPLRKQALTDWSYHNPMERLVEIFSKWGNSEDVRTDYEAYLLYRIRPETQWIGRGHGVVAALARGHKIGIIGGSDSHQGLAGSTRIDSPRGTPLGSDLVEGVTGEEFLHLLSEGYTYDHREPKGGGGGLTAVWASDLTRDIVWDALYNRHTYATTGIRPIIRFAVQDSSDPQNTAIMGEEISVEKYPILLISLQAETGSFFEEVELWKNGVKIASSDVPVENTTFVFEDRNFQSQSGTYYLVRCLIHQSVATNLDNDYILKYNEEGGFFYESDEPQLNEVVWTSPIWVD
jgi:hypothetical protein